jgi:predicted ester cyclase
MLPMRWSFVLSFLLAAASLLGGCKLVEAPGTSVTVSPANEQLAANKQIVEQLATAWNEHDYDSIRATLDANTAVFNPEVPAMYDAKSYVDLAKYINMIIPSYQVTNEDVIAEGDRVVARQTFTGKMGSTPFDYTGLLLLQLKEGKIIDLYEISDELAVGKIVGEIPNKEQKASFGWQGAKVKPPATVGDPAQNKQIVQQWWEGDAAAQQALAAPDFMYYNPWSEAAHTYADRTQIMTQLQTEFPDLKFAIEGPIVAENDRVGFRFMLAGERVKLPGAAIYRLANGKIAEEWILWANTSLYSALGNN